MVADALVAPDAYEFIERQQQRWSERRWIKAKDILRNGRHVFARDGWTFHVQSNHPGKVLVVERLRYDRWEPAAPGAEPSRVRQPGDIEYRMGYFIVSRAGKWWWGQFAPFIPSQDFEELIQKARDEGTILSVETP